MQWDSHGRKSTSGFGRGGALDADDDAMSISAVTPPVGTFIHFHCPFIL